MRCDNCHEELVIFEEQMSEHPRAAAHEFMEKVEDQREEIRQRRIEAQP